MSMSQQQLADIEACRSLVIEFAACVDARNPEGLRALMTTDASFARPTAPDVVLNGIDTIVTAFGARPRHIITQHMSLNIRIRLTGPDTAEGDSVIMLFMGNTEDAFVPAKGRPAGPPILGTWNDRFTRTADGWRFQDRRGAVTLHGTTP